MSSELLLGSHDNTSTTKIRTRLHSQLRPIVFWLSRKRVYILLSLLFLLGTGASRAQTSQAAKPERVALTKSAAEPITDERTPAEFSSELAQGRVTDEQAKLLAATAVRTAAGYPDSKPLRAHRRENLEDDLFRFQTKVKGKVQKAVYFYEVTGDGYFVNSNGEAVSVTSSHGGQFQLVAVSVRTGQTYLLWRSDNAASQFNRMIKDSEIRIDNAEDARAFASFYFTLVADPAAARIVFSSRQLKHKVEDYFSSNYSDRKADRLFRKWWAGFLSNSSQFQFDFQPSESSRGYEARVAAISGTTERVPRLDEWTLRILADGSCEVKRTRMVFPSDANFRAMLNAGNQ